MDDGVPAHRVRVGASTSDSKGPGSADNAIRPARAQDADSKEINGSRPTKALRGPARAIIEDVRAKMLRQLPWTSTPRRRWPIAALSAVAVLAAFVGVSMPVSLTSVLNGMGAQPAVGATTASIGVPSRTYVSHYTLRGYEMLVIGPDQQYTQVITASGRAVTGTVTDTGQGDLLFVEGQGGTCAGQPGTYAVSVERSGFYLTPVRDPCPSRQADFSSSLWRPYPERTWAAAEK